MKQNRLTFERVPEAIESLLEELAELKKMLTNQKEQPTEEKEEYLTPSEMMQLLKISSVTLWNWDKKGITRPLRIGNQKRYRHSDLEKIIIEFGKKLD